MNPNPLEKTIVSDFLALFPELQEHPDIKGDDYSDTPYSFFGVIRNIIEDGSKENSEVIIRILKWLDTTLNNSATNDYVNDMLWIEFFEGSEVNDIYRSTLLSNLSDQANLKYRQYLYIMENGGLTDPKTGEILKYVKYGPSSRTGKFITDIK
jgi:hypothetical protein